MELPGLGTFTLDPDVVMSEKPSMLEGVAFQNDPSIRGSADLVSFISQETGKMKALAIADLDSHLELAHQFMNIGKPFLFEGIGSLVKLRSGEYSFLAGPAMPEILPPKIAGPEQSENSGDDYKSIFYGNRSKPPLKKAVTLLLAISGIGLALVGGYTVYKKTKTNTDVEPQQETIRVTTPVQADTIVQPEPLIATPAGNVAQKRKFVLETAKAKRAFERYNRLKSFQWNVEMETNDSVLYTLYVMLPVSAMDTTRILDSLTRMNGRRVHVE
jgi:hypothetical protein